MVTSAATQMSIAAICNSGAPMSTTATPPLHLNIIRNIIVVVDSNHTFLVS